MVRAEGYVTEALVVRSIPFGETSQVLHLATPDHGLVAALAKGAFRPGSDVEGGLPLLTQGQAWLRPATRREGADGLELLTRFRQRDLWRGLGRTLAAYRGACYVLELLRLWMRPALPLPQLYGAGVTALRALGVCAASEVGAWLVWFEARAAAAAGHRPQLEACAACGVALDGTLAFLPGAGGAAHARCQAVGPRLALRPATLALLIRLYTQRLPDFAAALPTAAEVRALRRLHDAWIPWLLERRPAAFDELPRT